MKKSAKSITTQFKLLPIDEQSVLLNALGKLHFNAREARLKALRAETQRLSSLKKPDLGVKKTRVKPKPTHRSKKDKSLTWTGRGSMPRWMRDEMKLLKLKPDAFLIRKAK